MSIDLELTELEAQSRDRYIEYGYSVVDSHNDLRPGTRVRMGNERYHEAYVKGTGTIVVVLRKEPSAWSQKYRMPDVELVVRRDDPSRPIAEVAQYHVVRIPEGVTP